MKINGWQRIGIIASAAWVLGAGAYTYDKTTKSDVALASATKVACDKAHPMDMNKCASDADAYLDRAARYELIDTTVAALVPVPLGWVAIYFILFLILWVRRGWN